MGDELEAELRRLYKQVSVGLTRAYVLCYSVDQRRWMLVARNRYAVEFAAGRLNWRLWTHLGDLDGKEDGRCYYVTHSMQHVLSKEFMLTELDDAGITKDMVDVWPDQSDGIAALQRNEHFHYDDE